jgi:hypothetical protein
MIKYFSFFAENWFHNLLLAKTVESTFKMVGTYILLPVALSSINAETMNS